MKTFSFIVNPTAAQGAGKKTIGHLRASLAKHNVAFDFHLTESPGHATNLARNAKTEIVVAVGGDGTVNEVTNGLVGTDKILGVIPAGTGNDFAKAIGISSNIDEALISLLDGKEELIDLASIKCSHDDPSDNSNRGNELRHFVNGVGIGLDATVAANMRRVKYLKGTARYVASVLGTLGSYVAPNFSLHIDGREFASKSLLIAIGNGTCAGGGFYLTPQAKVNDGVLDVCIVEEISIPRILTLMPLVMRGKHENRKEVTFHRAKEISVSAHEPFFVHADGEVVGREVNSARIKILPGKLLVIRGRSMPGESVK